MLPTSGGGCLKTGVIFIKRGIFQGDSLSPLLFCMILMPLSNALKKREKIPLFTISLYQQISHPLYVDDFELFAQITNI